ncbi:probable LRR receptor-like serine/threonine-protein kinase At1g74360 [Pyrus x bretschneideri]|uniref:probable LRR receptor-like serine/threonine-protein kinase At1g74360 n=1 Tax=Pyrus x bretschneideri TaxID=225117 RepID=UPI00051107AB|nr:probable LRR receptor-like serine/threonine-protein kinase At1g74360 [Pyrus x bretschneideri]
MYSSITKNTSWRAVCSIFLVLVVIMITGAFMVAGDSLDTDREVLLSLKAFLQQTNRVNQGIYSQWNQNSSNPCEWPGISCNHDSKRVSGVQLSNQQITGEIFLNFSALTALSHLDLSKNTITGALPEDLSQCHSLKYLNLSHNTIDGVLNLNGLNQLEVLDLTVNRFYGDLEMSFPGVCSNLVVANLSANNFSGRIDHMFDECFNLQYLDLSTNYFSGEIWSGFGRLTEFSASENYFNGAILPSVFANNCSLVDLDLSENSFSGAVPAEISKCQRLVKLDLWGNKFTGPIPSEIGSISSLQALFLGKNSFSRDIPESLLDLNSLTFLDLSRNNFSGDIQDIFGRLRQVKFLVLHSNWYTGGIYSSGILKLPNVTRLDLSYNNFTGPLPLVISQMPKLEFLVLACNQFNGTIPPDYGNIPTLQALDLSFNSLTGAIPSTLGNLSSLLWLMLANNFLTGPIPHELGNCGSLLWLNLENNKLSGPIPSQLTKIGRNVKQTFDKNNQDYDKVIGGSVECLAMKRWIPADYPPFSFVYTILTRKSCQSIWDRLLKGNGLFEICAAGSSVRTQQISGYIQLSGNQLSGHLPPDIGTLRNFSMIHLGVNRFQGELPANIGQLPLVVFNISANNFSGQIPEEIGNIKCMQNLDMSYNNFSGTFPLSLNGLTDLSKFNISYNPLISGVIPSSGQLATFEKESYLGDPLLKLPIFIDNSTYPAKKPYRNPKKPKKLAAYVLVLVLLFAVLVCGVLSLVACLSGKSPPQPPGYLLQDIKYRHDLASSSSSSSPWLSDTVKIIRLDKMAFTHADILKATRNFSEDMIIGRGGFGTVYQGVLPDGRVVAVKKLLREGLEGEKEFRAEMEVLSGSGFGWPHPNLVTLHGWCLYGSEKILVYEYMEGGTLEDFITDRVRLTWRRRVDVAVDVARALVFLHHECFPAIVHRDVKASNVLLDKDGKARVTDFGLARMVDAGNTHVSTIVAGTVGYVAPEYGQTWQATTKGDVYSYGVLAMELATGRRAVDGGEECLVEWARRVMGNGRQGFNRSVMPVMLMGSGLVDGAEEMCELLKVGIKCTAEAPQSRPNMKEVLAMLLNIYNDEMLHI